MATSVFAFQPSSTRTGNGKNKSGSRKLTKKPETGTTRPSMLVTVKVCRQTPGPSTFSDQEGGFATSSPLPTVNVIFKTESVAGSPLARTVIVPVPAFDWVKKDDVPSPIGSALVLEI